MRHLRCLAAALLLACPLAAQASSLDRTLVLRVIREKQAEYQKCYTEALSWNPQLKGRLVIRFTVESDGEVSSAAEQAAAGERFPDEVVVMCVTEQFRQLRFPPGPQTVHIVYPMVFTPKMAKPQP